MDPSRHWCVPVTFAIAPLHPSAATPATTIDATFPTGRESRLFCGLMTEEIDRASEAATGVSSGCSHTVPGNRIVVLRLETR